MSQIEWKQVCYWYPGQKEATISQASFEIQAGSIVILCGASGSGKSTLLKQMKECLLPAGRRQGEIRIDGHRIEELDAIEQVKSIGFVGQNPDGQMVTDTVWHELAFGLESLGIANAEMKRRVSEMAEYFGISKWFHKSAEELSGGQKQMVQLASVLVMRPKVLLLDEPTAQLDPIMAQRFLQTLYRINQDFGITIILSEQCLEEALPMAHQVLLVDKGEVTVISQPRSLGRILISRNNPVFQALPAATKLFTMLGEEGQEPNTVAEGIRWLQDSNRVTRLKDKQWQVVSKSESDKNWALSVKNATFSYEKKGDTILEDFSIQIPKGEISAILGGNGSGKTTALKVLAGIYKSGKGNYKADGRIVYLPQNPQLMFTEPTVCEELQEVFVGQSKLYGTLSEEDILQRVSEMLEFMELMSVEHSHPFDLSGGQQQRLAIGKLLLLKPDVLLLDEPTKGLDGAFKEKLGGLLHRLCDQGKTIVLVSHDIDFCAENAQNACMLFQKRITPMEGIVEFFGENYFYTPAIQRIFQRIHENSRVITTEQALEELAPACGET